MKIDWRNAPEPSFKYGLNVFFNPKTLGLAFADEASGAPAAVRAPEGVLVMTLAEALADAALAPQVHAALDAKDGREARIAAWHRALAANGVVVRVPDGLECAAPVRIDLELADAHRVENLIVIAGANSRVTVVEHLRSAANAPGRALRSAVTDVIAMPGAKVTHISLQDFGARVTDLALKRGRAERDASITWVECVFGGGFAQSRAVTELAGEGAAAGMKTLFFGRDAQQFDLYQEVRHLASNTHADLRTNGALLDAAKTIYRGLIAIEKGTKGCVGKQKEEVLLLSPKAEIDTVPNLEIASEDVRCGHAASVGRLDKERLFYLMSRGLDEPTAKKFLVEGFFEPIVEEMRAAGLEDMVQCLIAERTAPLGVQC